MSNDKWKDIAIYLADCHAATAYDLLAKRHTSKTERARQLMLVNTCLECLKTGELNHRKSRLEDVISRLERTQNEFKKEESI
jgi:hypothetical protein